MLAKFFNSLYGGDSANGVKLCQGLTEGDFWARPGGCMTIYNGQDGVMDYETIQAVMGIEDDDISIINQALPPSTVWHYIRRQVSDCGIESVDSPVCIVTVDSEGDILGAVPNEPTAAATEQLAGGKFKLRWRYLPTGQEILPTGFYIYIDAGGGFDFDNPIATVTYHRSIENSWVSAAFTHGQTYKFCIRSYAANAGETDNTDYVQAAADSQGPAAASGVTIVWEEA